MSSLFGTRIRHKSQFIKLYSQSCATSFDGRSKKPNWTNSEFLWRTHNLSGVPLEAGMTFVREAVLISFTPRLSRRRRRSRNVPPFMYPTFAAISSTLALLVFKRCTARSTRRLWKYDMGDFPRTLCSLRVSVLLLAPTAFAALSRENLRASLARAQRSKCCTTGSEWTR